MGFESSATTYTAIAPSALTAIPEARTLPVLLCTIAIIEATPRTLRETRLTSGFWNCDHDMRMLNVEKANHVVRTGSTIEIVEAFDSNVKLETLSFFREAQI